MSPLKSKHIILSTRMLNPLMQQSTYIEAALLQNQYEIQSEKS